MIDTKKLANIIHRLPDATTPEDPLWEELADMACGPAESRQCILGMVGVSVAVLRRYDAFPKGKFVSLQIESDEQGFTCAYQMITATLNDDMPTAWALATSAVNQGMEWADDVMFATACACANILRDYKTGKGIVVETDDDEGDE
jgi:hypothetical protein